MKIKLITLALLSSILLFCFKQWYQVKSTTMQQLTCVNFDQSMQISAFPKVVASNSDKILYTFFKNLYQKNFPKNMYVSDKPNIPKIIHHIWMGSKMRVEDEPLYQSWHDHHPDWTFIFWTDNPLNYDKGNIVIDSFDMLEKLLQENKDKPQHIVVDINNLKFANRIYFDEATNYGERGDILDYEIVYRFGGVYIDCDFECYKPLDAFNHTYDFYTGVQPLDTNRVQLGAALFGAIPNHPILANCIANIKNNRHIPQIILKTGPLYFTQVFYMIAGKTGLKDIALPASYFYPCGYEQRFKAKEQWCKNESFAVHHWAGSWLKPEAFVKKTIT